MPIIRVMITSLSLDEQVNLLMQGTAYGDEALARNMRAELFERLKESRPLRVYCGSVSYTHLTLPTIYSV